MLKKIILKKAMIVSETATVPIAAVHSKGLWRMFLAALFIK
jgi:hypothetical protein